MSLENRPGVLATYHRKAREIPDDNDIIMNNLKISPEIFPDEVGSGGKIPPVLYGKASELQKCCKFPIDVLL
jgi:hypothetical protein